MVEQYGIQHLSLQNDDMPVHKSIPMERLDFIEPNQVKLLYYCNPRRFYVYLRQKIDSHALFQINLQRTMQNYQAVLPASTDYQKHQAIAAQDNHAVWHRATILSIHPNLREVRLYFVDVGQEENISITNIRPLPQEFVRQPAFAIPCRLYEVYPLYGDEQSGWDMDDPVHKEFNNQTNNKVDCKVCEVVDHICYDVQIEVPNVGDLGIFLWRKKLLSHSKMQTSQSTMYNTNSSQQQQSFGRIPPGFSGLPSSIQQPQRVTPKNDYYGSSSNPMQQSQTRSIQKPAVQQSPTMSTSNDFSSDVRHFLPQDGYYIITQVYSAVEFYGCSHGREKELNALHEYLQDSYNNANDNDQSFSVHLLMEGTLCAIQRGDKYHRVAIKHRESETRVRVKLVDHGEEILVDTSELLQLEKKCSTVPAFVQPFRLYNYDETQSTAHTTRNLKRLILNQRVQLTQHLPAINGFYPVEIRLSDGTLINESLLSSNNISVPAPNLSVEKVQPEVTLARNNDDLPAPQKLLTGRSQPGRFPSNQPAANDRFTRPQNQDEQPSRSFNRNQQTTVEQSRPFNRGFDNDEQRNGSNDRGGRTYNRNNDEQDNESSGQRVGGFANRGGHNVGFADRGNRTGYNDRNNTENNRQRFGGFNNRGSGFAERGARGGGYQDRNNDNRNNYNDNGNDNGANQRSHGFSGRGGSYGERGNRTGGFSNYRDRRDDREDSGRGGYGDSRGGRGGRGTGGRGGGNRFTNGFSDNNDNDFRANNENSEPIKSFSGWSSMRSALKAFEAGNHFTEKEIPRDIFQFVLSDITTPSDFFIQLLSKTEDVSQLTNQLQAESNDAPLLPLSSIKPNQVCLAKSSDSCWYRATVLSVNLNKIQVRFVDFGDTMEVDPQSIRLLASKFCLKPPYAYNCTLQNAEDITNFDKSAIITKCAGKQYHGKFEKQLPNEKYLLVSDDFEKAILGDTVTKSTAEKRMAGLIVYVDHDSQQFFIQTNEEIAEEIADQVKNMSETATDDIQVGSMIISMYEDDLYRAVIQEDLGNDVKVFYVDFGNTNTCPKSSLKKCDEKLKRYAPQAQRCELADVAKDELSEAIKQLDTLEESDKTEVLIVEKTDDLWRVRIYINGRCFNERFPTELAPVEKNDSSFDMDDQSSTTTTTTVQEQERPTNATCKRTNEEILSPGTNSANTSMAHKRQKSESESEANTKKFHTGVLVHIDQDQPIVYMQLLPEAYSILGQINEIIDVIVQDANHEATYEIGDYCIAQFSFDDAYYRARVDSCSSDNQTYTVYFLDYGNLDKNVPLDRLFPYSNDLKQIEHLAQKYMLEHQTTDSWTNIVRPLLDSKINDEFNFYYTDSSKATIHIKFDENESQMYVQPKTLAANISAANKDCFYIHILPDVETTICQMDEELHNARKDHRIGQSWQVNDRCIVLNDTNQQYFRGEIRAIQNDKYDVLCIDHGNVLLNCSEDKLYTLSDEELFQQAPLAHRCRLFGVNDDNQMKAIDEVIKHISPTERVTITTNNDYNDQCMYVMLIRGDDEIVNDRYQSNSNDQQQADTEKKTAVLSNTSDSAIAPDADVTANETLLTSTDQHLTSPIGAPQADSTHQYGDTTDVIASNRQSIDFGENDPSTSNTTIKEDGDANDESDSDV
ncbi:unnamed protein product [Adineta ricciae]|uniref:Tudor domain-containing protein n=1 Tax=Adineta ricciae TaxID=249248 RepID=A0A814QIG5_ADIRI|nr:unnamed protein product [Adineta ricciae]